MKTVSELCTAARQGWAQLLRLSAAQRDEMIHTAADALIENTEAILAANAKDIAALKDAPASFIDRLTLTEARISGMSEGLKSVERLNDPLGEIMAEWDNYAGLHIKKVRVPFGVIGIIYEARPNVTADAVGLCLKSGNAVVLRGSRDALQSNRAIVACIKAALSEKCFPHDCIQLIDDPSHRSAETMMRAAGKIDLLIPRGSAALIRAVVEKSTVPVIETGVGNCHAYIHEMADFNKAREIVLNGKLQRPGVCNALESLLIDEAAAKHVLPKLYMDLSDRRVEVVGCERAREIETNLKPATEEDFFTEYLALKISVKIVKNYNEAIDHINFYGSHHSDVIITEDAKVAAAFLRRVDSAAVYHNASTRFTDGGEFGMGAEMGISTQKLHARGPMGLRELTTYKYTVRGDGQIRG